MDFGDLEVQDDEPVGPPLARAARLVAVAHPGQALLSAEAHEALTTAGLSGWAAESLGRFDIVGLDPGVLVYQLVGQGFASEFPELARRSSAAVGPGGDRRVGAGLRAARVDRHGRARRGPSRLPARGRTRGGGADLRTVDGRPSPVRAPVRERIAAHRPRRPSSRPAPARLLAGAEPGRHGHPARPRRAPPPAHPRRRDGPGDGPGADREGRRRHLGRPSTRRRARARPAGEHPVRRRRQPVRRRPRDRRDLHRHRLLRDPRLRRPRAARRRAGDAGVGRLLPRPAGPRGARRLAAAPGRAGAAARRRRRRGRRPGDRSRPASAAMVRSTSSSTSCARRWPSRSRRRRCSCRPATRTGAWRRSRRPTPATSTVAQRVGRGDGRRAAAGTAVGRLRPVGHRQVVGGQGRARARAAARGRRRFGVLARHRDDTRQ